MNRLRSIDPSTVTAVAYFAALIARRIPELRRTLQDVVAELGPVVRRQQRDRREVAMKLAAVGARLPR